MIKTMYFLIYKDEMILKYTSTLGAMNMVLLGTIQDQNLNGKDFKIMKITDFSNKMENLSEYEMELINRDNPINNRNEQEKTADENSTVDTSFTQLAEDIKNSGGVLNLTHDYTYDPTKDKYYKEGILINNDVIINGNNHVINGSKLTRAFIVNSPLALTLINLTIKNCLSNGDGGAIHMNRGNLNIIKSSFINCTSSEDGGAIHKYDGTLIVNNSSFINCNSDDGGAIENFGELNINDSKFINCSGTNWGGAIYNQDGNLNVTDSTFTNCLKKEIYTYRCEENIKNCTFN